MKTAPLERLYKINKIEVLERLVVHFWRQMLWVLAN